MMICTEGANQRCGSTSRRVHQSPPSSRGSAGWGVFGIDVSGGSRDGRTELATIIEFMRPNDELVVTALIG